MNLTKKERYNLSKEESITYLNKRKVLLEEIRKEYKKILLIPFFLFKDLNRIYSSLIDSFLGIFSHPFSQLPLLNKSLKVIFKLMSQSTTETIK